MIYTTTLAIPGDDTITLNTEKLNLIKLKKSVVNVFASKNSYDINYSFSVENLNSNEKVFFVSTCEHLEFTHKTVLDMQRFTDEVYLAIQDKKLPDTIQYVKELKTRAISSFGSTILKENGEMTLNTEYDAFGYIYSEGDKVGTFERIKINNENTLELVDIFSVIELSKTENVNIEYSLLDKKYSVENVNFSEKNTINISNIIISDNDIEKVTPRENFETYEDFIADRRKLLNINVEVNNFSLDEFDDLF